MIYDRIKNKRRIGNRVQQSAVTVQPGWIGTSGGLCMVLSGRNGNQILSSIGRVSVESHNLPFLCGEDGAQMNAERDRIKRSIYNKLNAYFMLPKKRLKLREDAQDAPIANLLSTAVDSATTMFECIEEFQKRGGKIGSVLQKIIRNEIEQTLATLDQMNGIVPRPKTCRHPGIYRGELCNACGKIA